MKTLFIKKLSPSARIISIVILLIAIVIVPFTLFFAPPIKHEIMNKKWCITDVVYKGESLQLDRRLVVFSINGCSSIADFKDDGELSFPYFEGVESPYFWNEYKNGIALHCKFDPTTPNEEKPFDNAYEVKIEDGRLELKSSTMIIKGYFIQNY